MDRYIRNLYGKLYFNEKFLLDFLIPESDKYLISHENKKDIIYTYLLAFSKKPIYKKENYIIDYVFHSI